MNLTAEAPLVLVGGGKMGCAMLGGWLAKGVPGNAVHVVDPAPPDDLVDTIGSHAVTVHASAPSSLKPCVLVIAVKPQMMDAVLPGIAHLMGPETLAVSIAAGTNIHTLEIGLEGGAVARVMPNTPALVGRGVSVCVANDAVTPEQRALVDDLMASVGSVSWVDDEALIDPVTAVSGSGPAYVFLLAECLAEAGVRAGLPSELAERLARETVSGAGELLRQSTDTTANLRRNVTSPGGTTAAALEHLMGEDGLQQLITRAVAAATKRGRELAG